jgi:hypothetical protein
MEIFNSYIDFETNNDLIKIDTSQSDNIWQIGVPSKILFNSGYYAPKAIVTDTLNNYPINNLSTFQIKIIPDTTVAWYGQWGVGVLNFWHKYDMESNKDGGYIEIKYDNDTNWTNVIFDSLPEFGINHNNFYSSSDTIEGNIPAFTGTSSTWTFSQFEWNWCFGVKGYDHDSIVIKFIFKSDSTNTNQEGWLIDDLTFYIDLCGGGFPELGNDNIMSFVYPNPVTDISYFKIDSPLHDTKDILIYNSLGVLKKTLKSASDKTIIRNTDYNQGVYYYNVITNDIIISKGKFIIK